MTDTHRVVYQDNIVYQIASPGEPIEPGHQVAEFQTEQEAIDFAAHKLMGVPQKQ